MKQALLDTDSVSYFFRGIPEVVSKVDKYLENHGFINISVITYYEVMNGLFYKDAKKQLARFEEFVNICCTRSCTHFKNFCFPAFQ